MWEKFLGSVCGKIKDEPKIEQQKIKGNVLLKKKNVMDVTDVGASFLDRFHELFGKGVSFRLIGAHCIDTEDHAEFGLTFEWDESQGVPGALIVRNQHHSQLYLEKVTLEDVPGHGQVHFVCDSWVYPAHRYKYDRVFFTNKTYLPRNTPEALLFYREQELKNLQGTGSGMLKEWDRVYDYAYYNDLGSPEKGEEYARPPLGGPDYPYPRRARTGRRPNKTDPNTESRLFLLSLNISAHSI